MKKSYISGVVVIVAVIIIIAITNSKKETQAITLGVIGPFSGEVASMGEGIRRSIELVPFKNLKPIYQDDPCDTKRAISAYQLLKQSNVRYFYVPCSGSVMALAPLAKQNGDLIITGYSGSAEIRKTGLEVVRFNPDSLAITEPIIEYIKSNPAKKFALLRENQDYARSAGDIIKAAATSSIVLDEGYNSGDNTYKTILTKFKTGGVDEIIWIPVSDKAAQVMLKEMQTLAINKPLVGEVNLCDYPFSPADFGIHGICWKGTLDNEGFKKFLADHKAKYGMDSQYQLNDALTYDSVKILDEIVAKYDKPEDVAKEIVKGVRGEISNYVFDEMGEVTNVTEFMQKVEF